MEFKVSMAQLATSVYVMRGILSGNRGEASWNSSEFKPSTGEDASAPIDLILVLGLAAKQVERVRQ